MDISTETMDLLAYESASFFDAITGDCFLLDEAEAAFEAQYSHFYNEDNGDKSYIATIGKKTYSKSIDNDSPIRKKMIFHAKRIGLRILVAIINGFKKIGEILRALIQGLLIPLNAIIQAVTGRPNETLALFTNEEKRIFDRLKREAETKIANVGRYGVQEICKCMDAAFKLSDEASRWTTKAFAKGMDYELVGLEKDNYDDLVDEYEKQKSTFEALKDKLTHDLEEVDRTREIIENDAKGIKSKYYRRALLVYMTITKQEVKYAITKAKELNAKSTEMVNTCQHIHNQASAENYALSPDVNKIATQYNHIAVLCNNITSYLNTFLNKFNIKAKIESTGAGN